MPNFVSNTITVNGEGQIAAAMAGVQMVLTRVQVGSGIAVGPLPPLTALVNPVMNLTPLPPQVSANNLQIGEVVVMAVLDSANVTATFNLVELGVFAKSGGGPEQLIAYCQCSSPYDSIAPGSGSNRLQLNLQVPLIVGPGALVNCTVQAGNPVYVPPVVAGPGIVVDAPTDNSGRVIEWIVSTPRISQSTWLYVANEYTQNIAPYFQTLQNAMNYLSTFSIASGVYVGIFMAAETFNLTTTTTIDHINGSQIYIYGTINPDVSFNGVGSITGSAGNWQIQLLNVSDTTNIRAGMFLNIYLVAWNWSYPLVSGCHQVIGVAGSTVTIQSFYYAATWPSMSGVSGTMTPLTTIINQTDNHGSYGLLINNSIGAIQNIAIINSPGQATNYSAVGVGLAKGNGYFNRLGLWGWRSNTSLCGGLSVWGISNATIYNSSASLNDNGFSCSGGAQINVGDVSSTHNLWRGYWAEGSGIIDFGAMGGTVGNGYSYVAGNRERGILVSDTSYCAVTAGYAGGQPIHGVVMVCYNGSYGIHFWNHSKNAFSNSDSVFWCAYNTTYDIALSVLSSLVGTSYIQGTRVFNGTPGVLTPDGCIYS